MRVRIGPSPGSELLRRLPLCDGSRSGDCQVLSNTAFSDPAKWDIMKQLLPASVAIQLTSAPAGALGPQERFTGWCFKTSLRGVCSDQKRA
jgi:hypothetical protein